MTNVIRSIVTTDWWNPAVRGEASLRALFNVRGPSHMRVDAEVWRKIRRTVFVRP